MRRGLFGGVSIELGMDELEDKKSMEREREREEIR